MPSHLAQEWTAGWPLPAIAVALLVVLSFLRAAVDPVERGRVKAGIFFAGAYLAMTLGFGLLHRPLPGPTQHDWLRVLWPRPYASQANQPSEIFRSTLTHAPKLLPDEFSCVERASTNHSPRSS